MKRINIPRIIWVSSLFLILMSILFLVAKYKIYYEYLRKNYLYFYQCDNVLCVSNVKDNNSLIYSKYDCGYENCPSYIKNINEDYVILNKDKEYILYNFRKDKVINDKYEDYEFINNSYIIVSSKKKKGIITLDGKVLIDTVYDDIGYRKNEYLEGYNINNIIVKNNDLYGIISYKVGNIIEELKYTEENIDVLLNLIKEQE